MKLIILFVLSLFPMVVSASCENAASAYGNGEGIDVIPSNCLSLASQYARAEGKKVYEKTKTTVVGFRNILFVNDQVFAGEYTMLQDVIAVAYHETKAEVAALERNGDVLIFNAKIAGNVAPIRVIRHQDLDGATDVSFVPERDEVAVFLKGKKEIVTFSRLANFFGREGDKKLSVRRHILNAAEFPL